MAVDFPDKLNEFRDLLSKNLVRYWQDEKDIKLAILEKLPEFSRDEDLAGWVRGDSTKGDPVLIDEIGRFGEENKNLRRRLAAKRDPFEVSGLSYQEMKALLIKSNVLELFDQSYGSLVNGADEKVSDLAIKAFDVHLKGNAPEPPSKYDPLIVLGLVEKRHWNTSIMSAATGYFVTHDGKKFHLLRELERARVEGMVGDG